MSPGPSFQQARSGIAPLLVDKKFYFAAVKGFLGVVGKSDEVAAVPGAQWPAEGLVEAVGIYGHDGYSASA